MTVSHYIVTLTGLGYLIVGIQQGINKNLSGFMIWVGYAFAQAGLYQTLK